MDFLLGLAAGYLLTWPGIIALWFLGIYFEHTDSRGLAVFTALVALISSYFFFHLSLETVVYGVITYLAIGLVWSVYRYRRFVRAKVEEIKSNNYSPQTLSLRISELHPLRMVDTIVAWIIVWPFSAIEHAISDILDTIQLLVTRVFRSVYVKIFESATKGLIE